MKKASAIGLVIGVAFMSIIVGIAAIPDEVLELNPLDKSESPVVAAAKVSEIIVPEAPVSQITVPEASMVEEPDPQVVEKEPQVVEPEPQMVSEPEPQKVPEPEPQKVSEPESQEDEPEGKVIKVEINDGVGAVSR